MRSTSAAARSTGKARRGPRAAPAARTALAAGRRRGSPLSPRPGSGGGAAAWRGAGCSPNQAARQKENAQLTSAWCRRIARSERTWKSAQQVQPAGVDRLRLPHRLGQEELQPLHRRKLGPGHRLRPRQGRQRLVPLPRRQQPGQVLPEPPPLRYMGEQVIETGPRTPPADPAQADTPPAWSSLITGLELIRKPTPRLPLSSLDPTDYRYVSARS